MRSLTMVSLMTLCPAGFVAGQEQLSMRVSVCNLGHVREFILTEAKAEAETVFNTAGIRIIWKDCDAFPSREEQAREPLFIVRLIGGKPPHTAGPLSLDTMGKAYVPDSGRGHMADAYFKAIQDVAEHYRGDAGALLGLVIAHELGHLLRGLGHSKDGVMRTPWNGNEINALRQRWFKFNAQDSARIRRELQSKPDRDREK